MFVIDTDVASAIQKGRTPAWVAQAILGREVWLTFIAVGELAKWAEVEAGAPPPDADSTTGSRDARSSRTTSEVARTWGVLAAAAQRRGRPRPQNDMWVAACCIRHGSLWSRSTRRTSSTSGQDGLELVEPPE